MIWEVALTVNRTFLRRVINLIRISGVAHIEVIQDDTGKIRSRRARLRFGVLHHLPGRFSAFHYQDRGIARLASPAVRNVQ